MLSQQKVYFHPTKISAWKPLVVLIQYHAGSWLFLLFFAWSAVVMGILDSFTGSWPNFLCPHFWSELILPIEPQTIRMFIYKAFFFSNSKCFSSTNLRCNQSGMVAQPIELLSHRSSDLYSIVTLNAIYVDYALLCLISWVTFGHLPVPQTSKLLN